jgi:hypothetical protein
MVMVGGVRRVVLIAMGLVILAVTLHVGAIVVANIGTDFRIPKF